MCPNHWKYFHQSQRIRNLFSLLSERGPFFNSNKIYTDCILYSSYDINRTILLF